MQAFAKSTSIPRSKQEASADQLAQRVQDNKSGSHIIVLGAWPDIDAGIVG
jgi:hypothetical protein